MSELIAEHRPALMSRATRLTGGDHAWAEDVVQETFIRAWRHRERMTEQHGSVRAWLMRVAHNVAVDGHRGRRAHPSDIVDDLHASEGDLGLVGVLPPPDVADSVETAVVVDQALALLDPQHRRVLESVYLEDRSIADTARELDLPVGTVKSRAFYALRRLRSLLDPAAYGMAVVAG